MLFKTTNCYRYNHPELCFNGDTGEIPEPNLRWLIQYLETEVARGVRFQNQSTLKLGWMPNRFELMDDGCLYLTEPDFKGLPLEFTDTVTNTLKHLRQQQDIIDSCGDAPEADYPEISSAIIICKTYAEAANIFLSREAVKTSLSGWFFRDLDNDNQADYTVTSLYEFACNRPDLIRYLALPVGYGVYIKAKEEIKIIKDRTPIAIVPDSWLDKINQQISKS